MRGSINFVSAKLAKEFASLLIAEGKLELLKETLAKLISQHTASSELLLWFGRERNEDFADILGPEVFRAMLTAMERDQFNEKRSNRLRDFILEDQELLGELTATADIEVIKDLTRALQLSPVFDDMDKRSLLARLVKTHPAVQSLVSGEQTKQDSHDCWFRGKVWNAAASNTRNWCRKKFRPTPRKSPSRAATATCAKTTNTRPRRKCKKSSCARRKNSKPQLMRARGRIFPTPKPTSSTSARLSRSTDLETEPDRDLHDSRRVGFRSRQRHHQLSDARSAQALLNHKVGDEVEFELHGTKRRQRIENIEAGKIAAPVVNELPAETEAQPA